MMNLARSVMLLMMAGVCFFNNIAAQPKYEGKYPYDPAMHPDMNVIPGEILEFQFTGSKIYPGTERKYWVYVPAAYKADKPACLYVCMDEILFKAPGVFDNLISTGEMPITIGVFVSPGQVKEKGNTIRFNRSYEFDTTNDLFVRFLLEELLPDVETKVSSDGRAIKLSKNPNDCAIAGASSGGICAFTAAWERPDAFRRVYSAIGTFMAMRGGNEYPALIRKTEPKPLRVFLEDGSNDVWNPIFGHWFEGNLLMESALSFAGYEVNHSWGSGGHDCVHAEMIFPDVMRWLWKGWPREVEAGVSRNDLLSEIIDQQSDWKEIGLNLKVTGDLFSNAGGELLFQTDDGKVYKIREDEQPDVLNTYKYSLAGVLGDDLLFVTSSGTMINSNKESLAKGIQGIKKVLPIDNGTLYVNQTLKNGIGRLWRIKKDGSKEIVDEWMHGGDYLAISPDHGFLVRTEKNSQWLCTYVLSDTSLPHSGQRYYWLHNTAKFDFSENGNMIFDHKGNLYVATSMGVQVCDQSGLVRAILTVPSGKISSLCFGGKDMNILYILSEGKVYARKLNTKGVHSWDIHI